MTKKNANGRGTIRRRANGSWELRETLVVEGSRRQVSVSGRTQSEARERMRLMSERSHQGQPLRDTSQTVDQWYETWSTGPLSDSDRRPATRDQYTSLLVTHVLPRIGATRLSDVHTDSIRAVLRQARNSRSGKPLGASSKRSLFAALNAMFADAVEFGLLATNPVELVVRPKQPRSKPRALPPARVTELLAESAQHPWHAVVALACFAGLRRGEILGLQWRDVDFEAGTIEVVGNLTRTSEGLCRGDPKSEAGFRTVPMVNPLQSILRDRRRSQQEDRLHNPRPWPDNDLVMTQPDGHPIDPRTVSRWYEKLARDIGLDDHGLHALRHSAATMQLASRTASIVDIAKQMGWSNPQMLTEVYADAVGDNQRAAMEAAAAAWTAGA